MRLFEPWSEPDKEQLLGQLREILGSPVSQLRISGYELRLRYTLEGNLMDAAIGTLDAGIDTA